MDTEIVPGAHPAIAPTPDPQDRTPGAFALRGAWLAVARGVWLVVFAGALVQFALALPVVLNGFQQICAGNCFFTAESAQALAYAGISPLAYTWFILILTCAIALVSAILALALFWRRSRNWLALVVALFLIVYPIGNFLAGSTELAPADFSLSAALLFLAELPGNLIFYAVFLIFPSGRFVPRWSWLLLVAWIAFMFAGTFASGTFGAVLVIGYPLLYGSAIACQFYRYRHASTLAQRQQTKWVVFGLIASLLANQAFWLPSGLTPLGNTLYMPLSYVAYLLFLLLLPLTFFIAMQRHRLFDIDHIINRTLVYGSLTAILAATYAGGIIGLQHLFHTKTGQDAPLAVAISTLAIAALFQPLRAWLQRTIDRRFFRTKYDAHKTVATFSQRLRDQTDLARLSAHLVEVVDETMRPTHISLWLCEPASRGSSASAESAQTRG